MPQEPNFTIYDVQYSEDAAMYRRALELFRGNKVADFRAGIRGYAATVQGTRPYAVSLSSKAVDHADCTCYMGQNAILCKHVLAVALEVLYRGGKIDKQGEPTGASALPLDTEAAKLQISAGMRKIRAYSGPSRVWFSYQRGLSVGCGMILAAAGQLRPSPSHAKLIWKTVLRLSEKMATGGVDDSDGTVGACCNQLIAKLNRWSDDNPDIQQATASFKADKTGFSFEDALQP